MTADANDGIHTSMIQPRGPAYRQHEIVKRSHYNDPIDHSAGRVDGNSHIWGDASAQTQSRAIDALIASGERAGLQPREIAYVLAIARVESGFNPDAAAGTSSAYGLGQFVKNTGAEYGVNDANRNDLRMQADVLVAHYQKNAASARHRGHGPEYIYKYHHDGEHGEYGGLEIARKKVLPYLDQYEQFVRAHQDKYGVQPPGPSLAHRRHGHSPHPNAHGHHAPAPAQSQGAGPDSNERGQQNAVPRLTPSLQRIVDAMHSGDQARIDAAFEQNMREFYESPKGQAIQQQAQLRAQQILEQEQAATPQQQPETRQQQGHGPRH